MPKYNELINAYETEADRVEGLGEKELAEDLRREAKQLRKEERSKMNFDGYVHPRGLRRR